jgi:hypothetical protein
MISLVNSACCRREDCDHMNPLVFSVRHGWSLLGHYYVAIKTTPRTPEVYLVCEDEEQAENIAAALTQDMDDAGAEEYAARVARKCKSKHAPCGGCMQGGLCDNYDGIESREEEQDNDDSSQT